MECGASSVSRYFPPSLTVRRRSVFARLPATTTYFPAGFLKTITGVSSVRPPNAPSSFVPAVTKWL